MDDFGVFLEFLDTFFGFDAHPSPFIESFPEKAVCFVAVVFDFDSLYFLVMVQAKIKAEHEGQGKDGKQDP